MITGFMELVKIPWGRDVLQGRVSAVVSLTMGCVFIAWFIIIFFPKSQRGHPRTHLTAVSIEQAVNFFISEYDRMPVDGTSDRTLDTSKDTGLLEVLLGRDTDLNPKGLVFLSMKEGRPGTDGSAGRDGLIYSADHTVLGLFDPWGAGYRVRLDLDGDGNIRVNGEILQRRVAVWSLGPDGVSGTADDVRSW